MILVIWLQFNILLIKIIKNVDTFHLLYTKTIILNLI